MKRSSADVLSLLERYEVEDFHYRESFRESGAAKIADRWMLLSETNRVLEEARLSAAERAPKPTSPYRKDIVPPFEEATRRSHAAPRLLELTREFVRKKHEDLPP